MSKTACDISLKWCVRRGYYFDYEAFGRELFMWDCDKGLIAVVLCPGKETVICSAVADTARPSPRSLFACID